MRKILLLSVALTAILAGPALAQRGDDHGRGGGGRGGPPAHGAPHAAPAPAPHAAPAPAPQAAPANRAQGGREQARRAAHPPAARNNDHGRAQANRGGNNRPAANRGGNNSRPGNNAARGRPNPRYSQYHRAFNAPHRYRYRGPAYRRPSGWYARRWTFGDFLPSLFWSSNYWINDFGYYGLMAPPPGTVWVRDGDDALLIDRYSGEIIRVEYGIFY